MYLSTGLRLAGPLAQLTTGSIDVGPTGVPERRLDADEGQLADELLGTPLCGGVERRPLDLVEHDEVDVAEGTNAEVAEGLKLGVRVVDTSHEGVFVGGATPCLVDIGGKDIMQVDEGPAPHTGHDGVALRLDRGVEGDCQRELLRLVGKARDARDDAAGGDREMTRADAKAVVGGVEPAQGGHGRVVVGKRLSLAHEHDAGDAGGKVIGDVHDLVVYLVGGEGARKTGGTGGAERTAHTTARLRARTYRETSRGGGHADAFDADAILELEQVLTAPVNGHLTRDLVGGAQDEALLQLLAQGRGEVRHLVEARDALLPDPVDDLLDAVGGGSQGGKLAGELVLREGADVGAARDGGGRFCGHGQTSSVWALQGGRVGYPHGGR